MKIMSFDYMQINILIYTCNVYCVYDAYSIICTCTHNTVCVECFARF